MTEYIGGDEKYLIQLSADGFDMTMDSYRVCLKRGSYIREVETECIVEDDENYYLCLTKELLAEMGTGEIYVIVYADVPDAHFSFRDGIRTEVYKQLLCTMTKV